MRRIAVAGLAALGLAACQQSVVVRPVAEPGPRTEAPRSAADGTPSARRYEVVAGDTLYKIALQYGLDYRELARWNGIEPPYTIYPRQQLRLDPPSAARASDASASTRAPAPAPARAMEGVQPVGGAVAAAPAPAASSLAQPAPARAPGYDPNLGVTLPEGAQVIGGAAAAGPVGGPAIPAPPPERSSRPATTPAAPAAGLPDPAQLDMARPSSPARTAPLPEAVAPANPPANAAATPALASNASGPAPKPSAAGWIWPTEGKVVTTFAPGDPTRQGIRITGTLGQPVLAARDGEVVYSGTGLIGYGELIIVKHSPELLSAYGHNRVRLVKEGQKVKAGEKIAEMGATPANRVLLHFEIRRNGKPVDPLPLLPAR